MIGKGSLCDQKRKENLAGVEWDPGKKILINSKVWIHRWMSRRKKRKTDFTEGSSPVSVAGIECLKANKVTLLQFT